MLPSSEISVSHFSGCKILTFLIIFHQGFNLVVPHLKLHLVLKIFPTRIDFHFFCNVYQFFEMLSTHKFYFSQQISSLLPFFSSPLIFCFSFRFHASKELDGLTGRALETCCLPPDPPKSLLPH